jgi:hypothetical protein
MNLHVLSKSQLLLLPYRSLVEEFLVPFSMKSKCRLMNILFLLYLFLAAVGLFIAGVQLV